MVWLQEEKDGAIVGVSFLDEAARSGSIPDIQVAPPRHDDPAAGGGGPTDDGAPGGGSEG